MAKGAYIGVPTPQASLGAVSVGDTVKINESGVPVDYLVVQQGLPSSKYDSSCDGTWVLRKDCYKAPVAWESDNVGNYANSDIHQYLNGTFLGLFDANVQASIKQVKIPYTKGTSTAVSGANGLSTKAFLLCGQEINVTETDGSALKEDASVLAYFVNAGNTVRIAYMDGKAQYWALRTPYPANTAYICRVRDIGDVQGYQSAYQYVIRPAFILPSSLSLTNGVVTGAQAELVSVARKIKKGYVGVDGLARKIKKAYIGIGGVARPCWSSGELAYYGTITALSEARYDGAATTVGDYALIGCGIRQFNNTWSDNVDAYDKSLTKTLPTAFSYTRENYSAASVGNYALFGGGYLNGSYRNQVEAYDANLTRTDATTLVSSRYRMGATSFNGYALFAGGLAKSSQRYSTIDAYNTSLTRTNPVTLSSSRASNGATSVGNYAIFAGGITSSYTSGTVATVDAINTSFTRTTIADLSDRKQWMGATSVGNYAIFAGGDAYASTGSYYTNKVDAYDTSLTKTSASELSSACVRIGATSLGGYALFAGGVYYDDYDYFDGLFYATVDAYDESLTKTVQNNLSVARYGAMATTVGDYALFAGGYNGASVDAVDVFTIA